MSARGSQGLRCGRCGGWRFHRPSRARTCLATARAMVARWVYDDDEEPF